MEKQNLCLECKKKIFGRADKKFCNDYCRNLHNNKIKGSINNIVRSTNGKLKRNRNTLEILLGSEQMQKVHRDKLLKHGFYFDYHTHIIKNKKGDLYYFNYEYGYLQTGDDWFLIVKNREAS